MACLTIRNLDDQLKVFVNEFHRINHSVVDFSKPRIRCHEINYRRGDMGLVEQLCVIHELVIQIGPNSFIDFLDIGHNRCDA